MKIKLLLFIVLFQIACSFSGTAQKGYSFYGIKAAAIRSITSDLETTILSEPYFLHYTLNAKARYGWGAGLFYNYRFEKPYTGIEIDLSYSQQGSDLDFNNVEKDFNYKIQFDYQYINLGTMLKLYPFGDQLYDHISEKINGLEGLYIGAGPQVGLNIASQNIKYTSGGTGRQESFGSDLEQQQQLRNVLKGKTNFGFNVGLGFEFTQLGLKLDARYFLGLSDVVETQNNSYNLVENKNTNSAFLFSIGWDLSTLFDNKE